MMFISQKNWWWWWSGITSKESSYWMDKNGFKNENFTTTTTTKKRRRMMFSFFHLSKKTFWFYKIYKLPNTLIDIHSHTSDEIWMTTTTTTFGKISAAASKQPKNLLALMDFYKWKALIWSWWWWWWWKKWKWKIWWHAIHFSNRFISVFLLVGSCHRQIGSVLFLLLAEIRRFISK